MKSALSYKVLNNKLIAVESISLNEIKTKNFVQVLTNLNALGKTLVVLPEVSENVRRSSDNVAGVSVNVAEHVSVYDLLNADKVVVALASIKYFEEVLK
jgi:large subunit ribosomal protein L4